jgi:hypothetical protein
LLQVALRGHAALGERAPPPLMVKFAHIADRATHLSTSPALGTKTERYKQPAVKIRTEPRKKD